MNALAAHIKQELQDIYPESEIKGLTRLLLEKVTGLSYAELLGERDIKLSPEKILIIDQLVERLKTQEPIQYILGETEFDGIKLWVDPSVLIPRPETEELVHWILEKRSKEEQPNILDIGTGSGCIAIDLAMHLPNATVNAFDVSLDALNTAHENCEINNVLVRFFHVNILKVEHWEDSFDIIVSNPPYVLESESTDMDKNVLDHEPHMALFVKDEDPLIFYRYIAQFAAKHLNPGGELYFEINQAKGKETIKLLKELGFTQIELRKDIFNRDRMVKAVFNLE